MISKEVEKFCRKYNANVKPSTRRYASYSRQFNYSGVDPTLFQTLPYEEVNGVELEMSEGSFRALLEHDDWLEQMRELRYQNPNVDYATNIVQHHERECLARRQNPAVQRAYEEYLMLLRLSGY